MESSSILSLLTDDLLLRIVDQLSDPPDLKSFRIVCKSFHRVESLHRTHLRVLRPEFLTGLLRKYPRIVSLDLSVCPRIDDGAVSAILSFGSDRCWAMNLRILNLSRSGGLRSSGLKALVRSCPNLESIDVSHSYAFGDREASAVSRAVRLRDLRMDKCREVTDVGLAKIAVGCPDLARLSLKWCLEITELGLDLLSKKCPKLKNLDISYLSISNESLEAIANMEELEVLVMAGCGSVDDEGLLFIGNGCPSLQVFDVSRCDSVTSSGIMSVIRGHNGLLRLNAGYCFPELSTAIDLWFKHLKNLKTIILDGTRVFDSSFQIISGNCRLLVEIGLSKCEGVTDTTVAQLVRGCPRLEILNLTCCSDITDAAMSAVAGSCRSILCLKLESCCLLTDNTLDYLRLGCPLLEELDLTDCSGINDKGLEYLSKCSELVSLKLGLCTNITDKGLSYLASSCSKIRELDLYRCICIGDDGLAALSRGCRKLRKLNLSYCSNITDGGMAYLSHLEELYDLELRCLWNITGSGLTALASGCKKLEELDLKHCKNIDDAGFWSLAYYSRNLRQINLSHCLISDVLLYAVMGYLTRLQDVKLACLANVSLNGYELGLRVGSVRLKKVKLRAGLGFYLSNEILNILRVRGCKVRWV